MWSPAVDPGLLAAHGVQVAEQPMAPAVGDGLSGTEARLNG